MSNNLPKSNAVELLFWLLRLRHRFGVTGASMIPTLMPGEEVLVNRRAYSEAKPQIGEIVVARRPDRQELQIIKRIDSILDDGRLILLGDNPQRSTDSRTFGPLSPHLIQGKVTSKFG